MKRRVRKILKRAKRGVKRVAKTVLHTSPVRHVMARLHVAPWLFVPPGHFYSPIPALDEVRRDEQRVFPPVPHELPGIALDEAPSARDARRAPAIL